MKYQRITCNKTPLSAQVSVAIVNNKVSNMVTWQTKGKMELC